MPRAYSEDLRKRVIDSVEAGSSIREAARRYGLSASAAIKLVKRWRTSGSHAAKQIGGYRRLLLAGQEARIRDLVKRQPDLTLAEMRDHLSLPVDLATLWRFLDRLGLSYKKKPSRRRAGKTGRSGGAASLVKAAKTA